MTIFLEALSAPPWTHLSQTHNALLASVVAVGDCCQPYHGRV